MGFKVDEDSERGGAGGDYLGEVIINFNKILFPSKGGDYLREVIN